MIKNLVTSVLLLSCTLVYAQTNKLQFQYIPAYSFTLEPSVTVDTYPSKTTEYSPLLTHSFIAKFMKQRENGNYFSYGLGLYTFGEEVSYSESPSTFFSGRTDQIRGTYIVVPLMYTLDFNKLEYFIGVLSGYRISQTRVVGDGPTDRYNNEPFFRQVNFIVGTGINYIFELSQSFGFVTGLRVDYIALDRHLNLGLNLGLEMNL